MNRPPGIRALGIDLGSKRIGIAVSDISGTIASALTTVHRSTSRRHDHAAITKLVRDEEAEHLLKAARIDGSEEFNLARDKIREQLVHAKFELDRLEEDVEYQTQRAFFAARQAVRTHPYAAMGLVAGVLLIIGLMAKRR